MTENDIFPPRVPQYGTLSKLLFLLGYCILGTFLGTFIGIILGIATTSMPITQIMENMQQPKGNQLWYLMMIMTGISHAGGFWLAGLAYLKWVEKSTFESLNQEALKPILILAAIILTISLMPINEVFIKLNENMQLPKSLSGLQDWMKNMEESTLNLTKFLTDFTTFKQFVIAFIVIAIFAGIGEELIFRGILQNIFLKVFQNHHIAIWLAAFIFSAIHFQFFGFLPRMLLGAVMGYLYVWSGNLWVPIIAHITNNGLIVLVTYLNKIGIIAQDPETLQTPMAVTAFSVLLCTALLYFMHQNKTINTQNEI